MVADTGQPAARRAQDALKATGGGHSHGQDADQQRQRPRDYGELDALAREATETVEPFDLAHRVGAVQGVDGAPADLQVHVRRRAEAQKVLRQVTRLQNDVGHRASLASLPLSRNDRLTFPASHWRIELTGRAAPSPFREKREDMRSVARGSMGHSAIVRMSNHRGARGWPQRQTIHP